MALDVLLALADTIYVERDEAHDRLTGVRGDISAATGAMTGCPAWLHSRQIRL